MINKVFDDETILDGFKRLGDIIESQQQLNKLIDQRLKKKTKNHKNPKNPKYPKFSNGI